MSEILLVSGNPSRRRKHKARKRRGARAHRRSRRTRHVARRRRGGARSIRRVRARRNPVSLSVGGALGTIKSGAMGAVGALANDLALGYGRSYLPAMLQTGYGLMAVKLGSAVLVGFAADKVLKGKGKDLAVGAATVALHDAFKAQLAQMAPNLPLGDYIDFAGNPSNPSLLGYNPGEIVEGAGMSGSEDEIGELMTLADYNDDTF